MPAAVPFDPQRFAEFITKQWVQGLAAPTSAPAPGAVPDFRNIPLPSGATTLREAYPHQNTATPRPTVTEQPAAPVAQPPTVAPPELDRAAPATASTPQNLPPGVMEAIFAMTQGVGAASNAAMRTPDAARSEEDAAAKRLFDNRDDAAALVPPTANPMPFDPKEGLGVLAAAGLAKLLGAKDQFVGGVLRGYLGVKQTQEAQRVQKESQAFLQRRQALDAEGRRLEYDLTTKGKRAAETQKRVDDALKAKRTGDEKRMAVAGDMVEKLAPLAKNDPNAIAFIAKTMRQNGLSVSDEDIETMKSSMIAGRQNDQEMAFISKNFPTYWQHAMNVEKNPEMAKLAAGAIMGWAKKYPNLMPTVVNMSPEDVFDRMDAVAKNADDQKWAAIDARLKAIGVDEKRVGLEADKIRQEFAYKKDALALEKKEVESKIKDREADNKLAREKFARGDSDAPGAASKNAAAIKKQIAGVDVRIAGYAQILRSIASDPDKAAAVDITGTSVKAKTEMQITFLEGKRMELEEQLAEAEAMAGPPAEPSIVGAQRPGLAEPKDRAVAPTTKAPVSNPATAKSKPATTGAGVVPPGWRIKP